MAGPIETILTSKWSIGYSHEHAITILMFQFNDREPINLAIPAENAQAIAKAILAQYESPPPKSNRLS